MSLAASAASAEADVSSARTGVALGRRPGRSAALAGGGGKRRLGGRKRRAGRRAARGAPPADPGRTERRPLGCRSAEGEAEQQTQEQEEETREPLAAAGPLLRYAARAAFEETLEPAERGR